MENVVPAGNIQCWPVCWCTEPISLSVRMTRYQPAEITIQSHYSNANDELSLWGFSFSSFSASRVSAALPVHSFTCLTVTAHCFLCLLALSATRTSLLDFTLSLLCFHPVEYQHIINDSAILCFYLPMHRCHI